MIAPIIANIKARPTLFDSCLDIAVPLEFSLLSFLFLSFVVIFMGMGSGFGFVDLIELFLKLFLPLFQVAILP